MEKKDFQVVCSECGRKDGVITLKFGDGTKYNSLLHMKYTCKGCREKAFSELIAEWN